MRPTALLLACCLAAATGLAWAVELPKDVTTADVCAVVPGAQVARALGGTLDDVKLNRPGGTHARCRYTVTLPGNGKPVQAVLLLWLHAAGDFDPLRSYHEGPVKQVDGLGDAAFTTVDPDTGRHGLLVLVRPLATVEVTGPDAATVRAVATTAVGVLRPPSAGR